MNVKCICQIILLLGIIFGRCNFVSGQGNFGIKAGTTVFEPNLGNVQLNSAANVNFGMFYTVPVKDRYSLSTEMLFTHRRWKEESADGNVKLNNLHYVNIPLFLKFAVTSNVSIFAGPEIRFALNSIKSPKYDGENQSEVFTRIIYAGSVGVTLNITERFGAELKYSHGLNSFMPTVKSDYGLKVIPSNAGKNAIHLNLFYLLDR